MPSLTQIKAITDITYIPFGAVLLFAPVDIVIRVIVFFSIVPAAVIGLTKPEKSDVRNVIYNVLNFFLQPLVRIEFTIIGTITYFVPFGDAYLLIFAISLPFVFAFSFVLIKWLHAVLSASGKKDDKPPFIRG
jgi:hypothetical protein